MRTSLVVASAVAISIVLIAVTKLSAQRPGVPSGPRTGAALVNFGEIMQNSQHFKQQMEALKQEYEANAAELKKEADRGNQMTEELRNMPPTDPRRKDLEQQILTMRADYDRKGKRVTEDVRDGEAKIVLNILNEIKTELARFGPATGTQLILRYDETPPELTDPRVILQEIHKPIVYQSGLDVTPAILDQHNRAGVAGRAPAGAAPARPSNGYPR